MLAQLCRDMTDLTPEDIAQLEAVERQLPLMAELSQGDVFIDCPLPNGQAVVAAHARPSTYGSAYRKQVVGRLATPEKEPAVFHALSLRSPIRDIKAITQENQTVLQDVVPIFNGEQRCIALLIREKDISGQLLQEKKLQTLSKNYEKETPDLRGSGEEVFDSVALREVHHRVKNNLQLVASILSLQARRCDSEPTKNILLENVGRVLSIAAIHDILTNSTNGFRQVDSLSLLEHLQKNLQSLATEGKRIVITVTGSSAPLPADIASSMALVVNELVTNALKHAFKDRTGGHIEIAFCAGKLYHTVTVTDDGSGFDPSDAGSSRLGLNIVEATVRDKLKGHLTIRSDAGGSCASFDFKAE